MNKPLLIVFLGFPGSGKTYFATKLARELSAVTLNSDALRLSMFKSLDAIENIRQLDNQRLYVDVFGAMDYASKQTLLTGHSVIYDAQQTKRENRINVERIAREVGAVSILVWIKTDKAVALKRGQEREERSDSLQYSEEKMRMLIDRFDAVTDLPEQGENVIEINGEVSFDEQYKSFQKQLSEFS
ncbi:ATP-binding protein [Candidatus Saccharibacteria bacterium]|nr:ATP-binding protein [Candidatus Saccharibacteria bacterium]